MFPRPGADPTLFEKVSFVTRVACQSFLDALIGAVPKFLWTNSQMRQVSKKFGFMKPW